MNFLSGYIFTLCSGIIICSVIFTAVPSSNVKGTLKAVIGIIIALIALSPITYKGEEKFEINKEIDLIDEEKNENMKELTKELAQEDVNKKISQENPSQKIRFWYDEEGNIIGAEVKEDGKETEYYGYFPDKEE
ncbi:MAG: hypothetical protein IJC89_03895 [Clostridia bacterium]|nr:hypothetical protein [Clostridia bacterium]